MSQQEAERKVKAILWRSVVLVLIMSCSFLIVNWAVYHEIKSLEFVGFLLVGMVNMLFGIGGMLYSSAVRADIEKINSQIWGSI